jgi:hypothetical protein
VAEQGTHKPLVAGSNPAAATKTWLVQAKKRVLWSRKRLNKPLVYGHFYGHSRESADECSIVKWGVQRPLPFEDVQDVGRSAVSPVSTPIFAAWMKGHGGFRHETGIAGAGSARGMSQGLYSSLWPTAISNAIRHTLSLRVLAGLASSILSRTACRLAAGDTPQERWN